MPIPVNNQEHTYQVFPVGYIRRTPMEVFIEVLPPYRSALQGLDGFSHAQVFWWFNEFDDTDSRRTNQFEDFPFDAPCLGVFACRSPKRPNPIGLTTVKILSIDSQEGLVKISKIDAFENTPVLDLKGYLPSCDRVKGVKVPAWASHWPEWMPEDGLDLEN